MFTLSIRAEQPLLHITCKWLSPLPMSMANDTRIPVSSETRDTIRACKRGGESYDELLQKMAEQYDPDAPEPVGAEP